MNTTSRTHTGWPLRKLRLGFTLVELLVVIGIIAVLIAILLPVLGKVREAGNLTTCKANLSQMANAVRMYANDHKDHYPDSWTVGGAFYRRGPGERNLSDPTSVPEIFGLPALFDELHYLPGRNPVWICPSARDQFKDYKNTYVALLLGTTVQGQTSGKRGKTENRNVFYIYDNFSNLPYPSGIRRGPSDPNPVLPTAQWLFPHSYRQKVQSAAMNANDRRGAINVLFMDGSVGMAMYTNSDNPSGPPKMVPLHGE